MSVDSFDYVVVGGGTAGCVLAARLSENARTRVLLLEAGAADGPELMNVPQAWPALWNTSVDWSYRTTPQMGTGGAVHPWPRGKVLGGSSSINGMFHLRGHRSSYDAWEKAGATGWNYDTLLPFLKMSETAEGRDPRWRGVNGPMRVAPVASGASGVAHRSDFAAYDAALEVGHTGREDGNGEQADGVSWTEMNIANGIRQSAADGYLRPVLDRRPNLKVIANAHARRLLFEKAHCKGVEYAVNGEVRSCRAEREVILAGGVIGSPQLLLLSGVGPAAHLKGVGVKVVVDLPGVGENLHDHLLCAVVYSSTRRIRELVPVPQPHVLFRSKPAADPDLQLVYSSMALPVRSERDAVDPWGSSMWAPKAEDGYSILFSLMSPYSRGTLRLASADPEVAPIIDPAYLSDKRDVDRMVIGLRRAREMGEAEAYDDRRDKELAPGLEVQSEEECRRYIRRTASSYFHPVGTCAIGTGPRAVVDPQLRVRGVKGLRVADASVMPSIVSANTNATVLAIAERAAHFLKNT